MLLKTTQRRKRRVRFSQNSVEKSSSNKGKSIYKQPTNNNRSNTDTDDNVSSDVDDTDSQME